MEHYYTLENCPENVLEISRNNIKILFFYLYCFFIFNSLLCFLTIYHAKNNINNINKTIELKKNEKKKWFIDYSLE